MLLDENILSKCIRFLFSPLTFLPLPVSIPPRCLPLTLASLMSLPLYSLSTVLLHLPLPLHPVSYSLSLCCHG